MSSYPFEIIPSLRRDTLRRMISEGKRPDNRQLTSMRDLTIRVGVIKTADGSALVNLGNTKVIAGIKFELGKPFEDTPNEGNLIVNLETPPLAAPTFEPGPPDENAIEIARIIDRALRHSNYIPLRDLVIIPGKSVYSMWVDIYVLNHDGNLIDSSMLAAVSAIANAQVPRAIIDGENVKLDKSTKVPLNVNPQNMPLTITYYKIDKYLIIDPTLEEEVMSDGRFTVASDGENIVALQKGEGYFTPEEIDSMINNTLNIVKDLKVKVLEMVKTPANSLVF